MVKTATSEEVEKINTMKLIITFFTTKLQQFIAETRVSDADLLVLLYHLTDCIEDFISDATVIQNGNRIDSVTETLACENVFSCLACNAQTGNTYSSVVEHIDDERHAANVQISMGQSTLGDPSLGTASPRARMSPFRIKSNLEIQDPLILPCVWDSLLNDTILTTSPSKRISPVPMTMPILSPNNDSNLFLNLTISDGKPLVPPLPYNPFPLLPVELSNFLQKYQPLFPPPLLPIPQPFAGLLMNPAQGNTIPNFGGSKNSTPKRKPKSPAHGNKIPNFGGSNNNTPQGLPMNPAQGNTIPNFGGSNNSNTPQNLPTNQRHGDGVSDSGSNTNPFANGLTNNDKKVPSLATPTNDAHIPKLVDVTPVNNLPQDVTPTNENSVPPVSPAARKKRKRRNKKEKGNTETKVEVKYLNSETQSFLRQNFERKVVEYIEDAKILTDEFLYDDITDNLVACCEEMNFTATVQCFGSRINGVGTYLSDVDLNISVNDCPLNADDFLKQLEKFLSSKEPWTNVLYIRSRVSLVRARFNNELDCDISFNNDLAMANTKLIKYFYRIQPECHKLAVFFRLFAKHSKLYPYINMYTLNLLVFYYFQHVGYLPNVESLMDKLPTKFWPTEFTEKSLDELLIKPVDEKLIDLCIGLMDFYANHVDFPNNILSVFTGRLIPRSLFRADELEKTSDCYHALIQHMNDDPAAAEIIRMNFKLPIAVQDPFAHDHNVCRCLGKSILKSFKVYCAETREILLERAESGSRNISVSVKDAEFANMEDVKDRSDVENRSGLASRSESKSTLENNTVLEEENSVLEEDNSVLEEDDSILENNSALETNSALRNSALSNSQDLEKGLSGDEQSLMESLSALEMDPTLDKNSTVQNSSVSISTALGNRSTEGSQSTSVNKSDLEHNLTMKILAALDNGTALKNITPVENRSALEISSALANNLTMEENDSTLQ